MKWRWFAAMAAASIPGDAWAACVIVSGNLHATKEIVGAAYYIQPQHEDGDNVQTDAWCLPTAAGNLLDYMDTNGIFNPNYKPEDDYRYQEKQDGTDKVEKFYPNNVPSIPPPYEMDPNKVADNDPVPWLGGAYRKTDLAASPPIVENNNLNLGHLMETGTANGKTGTTIANGVSGLQQYLDIWDHGNHIVRHEFRPVGTHDSAFLASHAAHMPMLINIHASCVYTGMFNGWYVNENNYRALTITPAIDPPEGELHGSTLGHTVVAWTTMFQDNNKVAVSLGIKEERPASATRGCPIGDSLLEFIDKECIEAVIWVENAPSKSKGTLGMYVGIGVGAILALTGFVWVVYWRKTSGTSTRAQSVVYTDEWSMGQAFL